MNRIAVLLLVAVTANTATADSLTVDINPLTSPSGDNYLTTYSGTGFVGLYHYISKEYSSTSQGFIPNFGASYYDNPKHYQYYTTALQVDLTALRGANVCRVPNYLSEIVLI